MKCSNVGCDQTAVYKTKQLCRSCYDVFRYSGYDVFRYSGELRIAANRTMTTEKFWSFIDKDGPIPKHCPELGRCWTWTGPHDKEGYGIVSSTNFGTRRAHKVAAFLYGITTKPREGLTLHRCDNPPLL